MFFIHVCLALLLGFAPTHFCRESCVRGVRQIALRDLVSESEAPEDPLQEVCRTSCDRLSRSERRPKCLRLLREFAHGASLAIQSRVSPLFWAGYWKELGACTCVIQITCCRGPPC
jgi:hypothetical protein